MIKRTNSVIKIVFSPITEHKGWKPPQGSIFLLLLEDVLSSTKGQFLTNKTQATSILKFLELQQFQKCLRSKNVGYDCLRELFSLHKLNLRKNGDFLNLPNFSKEVEPYYNLKKGTLKSFVVWLRFFFFFKLFFLTVFIFLFF